MSREIDALVDQHVMNNKLLSERQKASGIRINYKPYSTDIAAAWEVINHIKANWLFSERKKFLTMIQEVITKREMPEAKYYSINWPDVLFHIEPRDISLAALKAKGIEVGIDLNDFELVQPPEPAINRWEERMKKK